MTSFNDWNAEVIEEFRGNEGRVGGQFEGAPMVLIHHIGAKSGTERVTPLVYLPLDGGAMAIIASKGGAPTNPDWYHNLTAHPEIDVEVGTTTLPVMVTEAEGGQREQLWGRFVAAHPGFGEYQTKTTRQLPVLILTPAT